MNAQRLVLLLLVGCLLPATLLTASAQAEITNLSHWTLVEDPPHAGFTAAADVTSAALFAGDTAIPRGTDIGFQSINANTVQEATAGYAFDPNSDFSLAIDYSLTFSGTPIGGLGLGLGIGEDADGNNSAGVAMLTSNGSPMLTFFGAARVNNADQPGLLLAGQPATLSGSLFVDYEAASGDVTIGASPTPAAATATVSDTFLGIQNQWNDQLLMASFFLRSDQPPLGSAWQGGQAEAVFSNFRVLSGSPVAIPEPSSAVALLCLLTPSAMGRRRRRR